MAGDDRKAKRWKLPGTGWRRSLLAVLLGNLIYFGAMDSLPAWARHQPSSIDVGLAVDFWICVLVYIFIRLVFPKL